MKSKIIATLGPATYNEKKIKELVKKGVSIFRLKSSYYSKKQLEKEITRIGKITKAPLMIDLEGPELRIRCKQDYKFKRGSEFIVGFTKKDNISFNHDFYEQITMKHNFIFDKGIGHLRILKKKDRKLWLKTLNSIKIKDGKGVNLKEKILETSPLSDKDKELLKVINKKKLAYVAYSYVRRKEDIHNLKLHLNKKTKIFSKIENKHALKNLKDITQLSDGIIVARGDLAVETSLEKIPILQKKIISLANKYKKPVVVATELISSMVNNKTPTRAEVDDIENCVFEGADMLLLTDATAVGKYPILTVDTVSKIVKTAEKYK
ncbi:MAG: pyruvate kinase [Promethearchaeota archaeon]|jgi:pyruvate kinase